MLEFFQKLMMGLLGLARLLWLPALLASIAAGFDYWASGLAKANRELAASEKALDKLTAAAQDLAASKGAIETLKTGAVITGQKLEGDKGAFNVETGAWWSRMLVWLVKNVVPWTHTGPTAINPGIPARAQKILGGMPQESAFGEIGRRAGALPASYAAAADESERLAEAVKEASRTTTELDSKDMKVLGTLREQAANASAVLSGSKQLQPFLAEALALQEQRVKAMDDALAATQQDRGLSDEQLKTDKAYQMLLKEREADNNRLLGLQKMMTDMKEREATALDVIVNRINAEVKVMRDLADASNTVAEATDRMTLGYVSAETSLRNQSRFLNDMAWATNQALDAARAQQALSPDDTQIAKDVENYETRIQLLRQWQQASAGGARGVMPTGAEAEQWVNAAGKVEDIDKLVKGMEAWANSRKTALDQQMQLYDAQIRYYDAANQYGPEVAAIESAALETQKAKINFLTQELGLNEDAIPVQTERVKLAQMMLDASERELARLSKQVDLQEAMVSYMEAWGGENSAIVPVLERQIALLEERAAAEEGMGKHAEAWKTMAQAREVQYKAATFEAQKHLNALDFTKAAMSAIYGSDYKNFALVKQTAEAHLAMAHAAQRLGNIEEARKHTLEGIKALYEGTGDVIEEVLGQGPAISEIFGFGGREMATFRQQFEGPMNALQKDAQGLMQTLGMGGPLRNQRRGYESPEGLNLPYTQALYGNSGPRQNNINFTISTQASEDFDQRVIAASVRGSSAVFRGLGSPTASGSSEFA